MQLNSQIRTGDRLAERINQAIRSAAYFVPFLSQEYWNPEGYLQEFELARRMTG